MPTVQIRLLNLELNDNWPRSGFRISPKINGDLTTLGAEGPYIITPDRKTGIFPFPDYTNGDPHTPQELRGTTDIGQEITIDVVFSVTSSNFPKGFVVKGERTFKVSELPNDFESEYFHGPGPWEQHGRVNFRLSLV